MNILITGGLGYLGSSLVNNSLYNFNITIVDNLYTQRYCSLFHANNEFKFIEKDFNDLSITELSKFHYVIHLAAIVDAANSAKQIDLINSVNIKNTIEFLNKCKEANTKVIFPSSTSVYGTSNSIVYEDDPSVLKPQSPYAEGKLKVEQYLESELKDYVTLRLGTVCGVSKGIRFQTCINKFCYQASFNQPLSVWRDNINLVRPYLSLTDFNYVINCIVNNWSLFKQQTFNVLTSNISLQDIIDKIKVFKPDIEIRYTDCPLLNQFSYNVSTLKIEKYGIRFVGNIKNDIEYTLLLLRGFNG